MNAEFPYNPAKVFTVDEANAMLPLVRAISGDMVQLSRDLIERRQLLDRLSTGRDPDSDDPYSDEVAQIEEELKKDLERLNEFADELVQLGVEAKGAAEGLVDFPAVMDDRLVYLCWRYDEPEVLYWHELDAGFAGRRPLAVGSVADDGSEENEGLLDS